MFRKLFKKKKTYLFSETENTACFTCSHVLNNGAPILYVSHDEDDGAWQFMCGELHHTDSDVRIITLKEATELDDSINVLHDMPEGIGAKRESINSEWKPFKN